MSLTKMVDGVSVQMTPEEEAEIRAEWAAWDTMYQATKYGEDRRANYPALGDQLDALWKIIRNNPNILVPDEAQAIDNQIQQIKSNFPKPLTK